MSDSLDRLVSKAVKDDDGFPASCRLLDTQPPDETESVQQDETASNANVNNNNTSNIDDHEDDQSVDSNSHPPLLSFTNKRHRHKVSSTAAMEALNREADSVRNLVDVPDEERQRQMSMIYSRRKRIRAKKREEQLDQQCVELREVNDKLRVENAKLDALLATATQQIMLIHLPVMTLANASVMMSEAKYDSALQLKQPQASTDSNSSSLAHMPQELLSGLWMQQQQQQYQQPATNHGMLLSSLIGQALKDEQYSPIGGGDTMPLMPPREPLPLPDTSRRHVIEHGLVWHQVLQQQKQQQQLQHAQLPMDSNAFPGMPFVNSALGVQSLPKLLESQALYAQHQQQASQEQAHAVGGFSIPSDVDEQELLLELLRRRQQGNSH